MIEEIWKDVRGFEGSYQVSNLGRVRSLDRVIEVHRTSGTISRRLSGKVLAPQNFSNHYLFVVFGHRGPVFLVHRLVAEHFVPNPLNKPQVNHLNFVRSDNRETNLEWATESENQLHSRRLGVTRNEGRAVIVQQGFARIFFRSITEAADHLGVTRPAVAGAIVRKGHCAGAKVEFAA